jgi:hypothetical protein
MKRRHFVFNVATLALLSGCGVVPNLSKTAAPRVARDGILGGSLQDFAVKSTGRRR